MMFWHSLKTALISIWTKKTRSILTMLGIIIGVSQIIVLIGLGNGIKQDITSEVTQLGTNILFILPGKLETANGGFNPAASVGASTITETDVAAIRQLPDITKVTTIGMMAAMPTAGANQAAGAMVFATEPNFLEFMTMYKVANGRFFTAAENTAHDRVIVLGRDAAAQLFPGVDDADVVGRKVTLGKVDFTIVGTTTVAQTSSLFSSSGSSSVGMAIVPFLTAKSINPNTQIFRVGVKADANADAKAVKAEITAKLKELHGVEDTTVFTQDDLLSVVDNILGLITTAIAALGAISLLVGGIGIMNIMLVSVTERTREIGLRKAVGATFWHILAQFLTESVIISLLGGAIGVAIAKTASIVVKQKTDLTILVDWQSILIATLFSLGVGVIFGLAPAIRAARKDPIEALRYE
jgi:putative ABC transport system permease protein